MTTRRPLVVISGVVQELPASDVLASTDLVGGFYYCSSSESLVVPVNRVVVTGNITTTDGTVTIDGILTNL